jgi:pimeloyl-ACP methyl ester carboxylesterase
LPEHGFNVLTFTSRRAKEELSTTRVRPWLTKSDVEDVRAAIRLTKQRFQTQQSEIGLLGISRGAASAICAAADEPAVGAVVTDGAFDTRWMIEDCMRKLTPRYLSITNLPGVFYRFFSFIVVKWSERRLNLRFVSVLNSFRGVRHIAFLFIHGQTDRYIPEAQASELYRRASQAIAQHLWVVPKAGHNESAKVVPEEYADRISSFFAAWLPDRYRFEVVSQSMAEALQ